MDDMTDFIERRLPTGGTSRIRRDYEHKWWWFDFFNNRKKIKQVGGRLMGSSDWMEYQANLFD